MDQWMAQQMYRSQRGDPFWGVIAEGGPLHANVNSPAWETYLDRLRATGRGHHADALAEKGGRPLTSGLD